MTYCFLKLSESDRYLPYTSLMTFVLFCFPFYTESVEGDQSSVTLSPFPGKKLMQRHLDVVEVVDLRS